MNWRIAAWALTLLAAGAAGSVRAAEPAADRLRGEWRVARQEGADSSNLQALVFRADGTVESREGDGQTLSRYFTVSGDGLMLRREPGGSFKATFRFRFEGETLVLVHQQRDRTLYLERAGAEPPGTAPSPSPISSPPPVSPTPGGNRRPPSWGGAVEQFKVLISESPGDDGAWGDLGDLLARQGDEETAQSCYTVARLLDWSNPEWLQKARMTGAVPALEFAGITDDEIVGDLGDLALGYSQQELAVELHRFALRLDPTDPEWRLKAQGGEPVEVFRRSLREIPGDDESWGDLGDLLVNRGDHETAQGCYTMARILDPEDGEWRQKSQLRNILRAVDFVGLADDEIIGDLGDLAAECGEAEVARELFRRALELDPTDSEWQQKAR